MEFTSLESCIAFIKEGMGESAVAMGKTLKQTGKQTIRSQVGGITGHLAKCVRVNSADMSGVEAEIYDDKFRGNGYSWVSIGYAKSDPRYNQPFFPMYGLEGGGTWNREATHIMEEWLEVGEKKATETFLSTMRGKGIPIG